MGPTVTGPVHDPPSCVKPRQPTINDNTHQNGGGGANHFMTEYDRSVVFVTYCLFNDALL